MRLRSGFAVANMRAQRTREALSAQPGVLDTLGGMVLSPIELVGMAIMLLVKMAEFILLAPFSRHRFAFYTLIFARDLKDMLFGPALRVVAISMLLGMAVALLLEHFLAGLLSQTGAARLVIVAAVQQIPTFVASGVLAARGALPLSVRLAEMVDRGQLDSMAIMGVDLVWLHAVPRGLAVMLASVVHALLAMVVFGLATAVTLSALGVVSIATFFAALKLLPLFERLGLIGIQLLTASLLVVAVAVVQGLQDGGTERIDLSRVSMLCIMRAATVVLVVNVTFALARLPDLPVLVWR